MSPVHCHYSLVGQEVVLKTVSLRQVVLKTISLRQVVLKTISLRQGLDLPKDTAGPDLGLV